MVLIALTFLDIEKLKGWTAHSRKWLWLIPFTLAKKLLTWEGRAHESAHGTGCASGREKVG